MLVFPAALRTSATGQKVPGIRKLEGGAQAPGPGVRWAAPEVVSRRDGPALLKRIRPWPRLGRRGRRHQLGSGGRFRNSESGFVQPRALGNPVKWGMNTRGMSPPGAEDGQI